MPDDPDYSTFYNKWVSEGKPFRLDMGSGYWLAIQDNDILKFVKQNANDTDNNGNTDYYNLFAHGKTSFEKLQ